MLRLIWDICIDKLLESELDASVGLRLANQVTVNTGLSFVHPSHIRRQTITYGTACTDNPTRLPDSLVSQKISG
jgi:hypothetical protein